MKDRCEIQSLPGESGGGLEMLPHAPVCRFVQKSRVHPFRNTCTTVPSIARVSERRQAVSETVMSSYVRRPLMPRQFPVATPSIRHLSSTRACPIPGLPRGRM